MTTTYATCDANGPISVLIEAGDVDDAIKVNGRQWIDDCRTDAEDKLGCPDGWDGWNEQQVSQAMKANGFSATPTSTIAGDWVIWTR